MCFNCLAAVDDTVVLVVCLQDPVVANWIWNNINMFFEKPCGAKAEKM